MLRPSLSKIGKSEWRQIKNLKSGSAANQATVTMVSQALFVMTMAAEQNVEANR